MAKILVIRGGAIGDFILTLPVLAALREQFPHAELEVLGYPHIASLALAGGLARAVRPIDARPLAGFFARDGELHPSLCEYLGSFAVIVSFLYDPDEIFRSNVARCSRAQFIAGPHRPDEADRVHATQVYLKTLERLAIFAPDPVPRLNIGQRAPGVGTLRLAVHPGSGSPRKNWPLANWAKLLRRIALETNVAVLVVGGEAEDEGLERLAAEMPPGRVNVARNLPLPTLAELLAHCAAFVGHDSGISHLAAAVGVPVTALWADTAENIWRPRGEDVQILKSAGGLNALEVDEVFAAVLSVLARPGRRVS